MNSRFPLDLYDRLAPARPGEAVVIDADDAKRLQAFLVGMNQLDVLMKDVDLSKLEGPKADELRTLLRREQP